MAVGKAGIEINVQKLSIKFGDLIIVNNGKLFEKWEDIVKSMKIIQLKLK